MEKTCTKCLRILPIEDFHWANKAQGKYHSRCKSCDRLIARDHYTNNKQVYADRTRIRNRKARKYLQDLKDRTPCADCGVSYPYWVLDFDHLKDKKFVLSGNGGTSSVAKVQAELAKCEIVCANCHRQRSQGRKCSSL